MNNIEIKDSEYQFVNPIETEDWDNLVSGTGGTTFFHTRAWAQTLAATYHYTPLYLVKRNENNFTTLIPLMEVNSRLTGRRAVSLPFTDHCALIAGKTGAEEILKKTIHLGQKRKWKYLEFRDNHIFSEDKPAALTCLQHTIRLEEDSGQIFKRFRSSTRRNISKAQKQGVKILVDNSVMAMKTYYRLHCLTRKRQGVPPQPYTFFNNIHEFIIKNEKGNIFLAKYDNRIVAGMVFFHYKKKVIYKFGASDMRFQAIRPNNLIMWQAVQWYAARQYDQVDLGRTEMDHTGLRQFKMGFNPQEREIKYYNIDIATCAFQPETTKVNNLSKKIFQILPVTVLRLIGRLAYKHIA